VSAVDRCAISYRALLEFTSNENHRWREWFATHPEAWELPFATGMMATIGGVVLHIFAIELRYAQRLFERGVTPPEGFTQRTVDEVFELGDNARALLVEFLTSAPESDLDRVLTFKTITAGIITANKHKIASNVFLHGMRHWAQIATALRQNGFTDQWGHDMLLSSTEL
jgi:uncharacterized damage-inducible protein DinB